MNQRTHAWIAIRAIALLEEEDPKSGLVKLLSPHACAASVGAWVPDTADAKRGGCKTENHVFKTEPYDKPNKARFVMDKATLLGLLGPARALGDVIAADKSLDAEWWQQAYRADPPKPGMHLPNRGMALCTMLRDLLIFGDPDIDKLLPGSVSFAAKLDPKARTCAPAAAAYFFMLSHFAADACMPCHADARFLSAYANGLHDKWEAHWSKLVGTGFEAKNLAGKPADAVLSAAVGRDAALGVTFAPPVKVPPLAPKTDPWLDLVYVCRAGFTVASIVANPHDWPYGKGKKVRKFADAKADADVPFAAIDAAVIHDAVLNTAILWKDVWAGASSKPKSP